jgi:EmrB/QacA subfamily drug resistance transporter
LIPRFFRQGFRARRPLSPAIMSNASPNPSAYADSPVRGVLPWLVAAALFMENLDATVLNTAVPTMAADLGVPALSLKSVLSSYTLSLAVFIPASGWMADRFGTRRVFGWAIAYFLAGSLFSGIAMSPPMLVASRILQGIGGAMMTPVGRIALVRSYPRSQMLAVTNFVVIPALIGPLLGPVTGGFIVAWLHWRAIFLLNLPIALAGLWFARKYMPDFRDPESAPMDFAGFVLFGTGIALLSYVLEVFGEHSAPLSSIGMLLAGAVVLLLAYGWHARGVVRPLLDLTVLRIRTFRVAVLGGFVTRLGVGGVPFLLPLLYQLGLGYAPWQAGLLTMPQAMAAIGMKVLSRRVLKRWGHRRVLIVNTVLLGATLASYSLVVPGTPLPAILALTFSQGFFASLQFTCMNSLVYADVSDEAASRAGSIASTAQQLSLSFGVATGSLVAAWFLGNVAHPSPEVLVPALHRAFLAVGALTVLSSLTFWDLRPNDGDNISNRLPRAAEPMAAGPEHA